VTRVLIVDADEVGLDFALRCRDAGHEVKLWIPNHADGTPDCVGDGLVDKPAHWRKWLPWADLVVPTGNSKYQQAIDRAIRAGFPVFSGTSEANSLELDREKGQQVLEECGIETAPYEVFTNLNDAIAYVKKTRKGYACKPWGGNADKSMTCVEDDPDNTVYILEKWKQKGSFKGKLVLQEHIRGIEMGIAGWFGPGGWCEWFEENFEEKKFMNDGLGCNTGEQGTVMRYVKKSKLFWDMLQPLTDYLHSVNYVGNVSVNCIIDEKGTPWPLEFTMRLGWPAFNIEQVMHKGDPVEWMVGLLNGQDLLEGIPDVAVGVVLTHGDYPLGKAPVSEHEGYPIRGITLKNHGNLHFQAVKEGIAPVDGKDQRTLVTAGTYVMVCTGTGDTVQLARQAAYKIAGQIRWPSNVQYRTDIGSRLRSELPQLHGLGYAKGFEYT